MSFKFAICDTDNDEAYRTTDPDLAAHCRWFDAKPRSAVRKDRISGSLRPAKVQRTDYDAIPLEKGKTYYLTCQYYLIKGPAFRMIPYPNVTYDEWRRCRPKPIRKGDIRVFENILSPQESFQIDERVALSIPGSKRRIAQIGDPVIAVTYDIDTIGSQVQSSVGAYAPYMQAFRPGICPKASSSDNNDTNRCVFFDPVALDKDIQNQDDLISALKNGKYFKEVHYIIAQDASGEPLRLGDTIGVTCQYIYNPPLNFQHVRRCMIKNVTVRQRFHTDFFDPFKSDSRINTASYIILGEGGQGTIPMIQATPSMLNISICDQQLGSCASIDSSQLSTDQTYMVRNLDQQTPIQQGRTYSLRCTNQLGDSCGEKEIIGGEPLYIENQQVSTGRDMCDVNSDGECNTLDLVECLKETKNIPTHCDLNKDDSITASDRSLLLNLAGQSVK
ncbi:MAG: hypothetical protein UZ21_OP11001000363 [Microgenomates bacterium OLB22]|nr:MAG: hypothetical protein UZ21_OP11001000363 [Microgenomates bacterium OLB22]